VVLDGRVLAVDEAGLVETLTERIGTACYERPAVDEADDRHRCLLCAHDQWPRSSGQTNTMPISGANAETGLLIWADGRSNLRLLAPLVWEAFAAGASVGVKDAGLEQDTIRTLALSVTAGWS
jgi:hypothetical protein